MSNAKRIRLTQLKDAKTAYRRGIYFEAVHSLKKMRRNLIAKLDHDLSASELQSTRRLLAMTNHQLSLNYEVLGNEKMADKRSMQAIKYYAGPNELGFAIILRDDGMRMLGRGKIVEAEALISQACDQIKRMRAASEGVPSGRLETEHWVTQSYLAQVMIAKGEHRKGVQLMRAADAFLREGTKRYRELENLMALIPNVSIVGRYPLIVRAVKLNYEHVGNRNTWLRLVAQIPFTGPLPKVVVHQLR